MGPLSPFSVASVLKKDHLVKNESKVHIHVRAAVMPMMKMQTKWPVQRYLVDPLLKKIERLAWSEKRD